MGLNKMLKLNSLFGLRRPRDDDKTIEREDDKAIVHQTVPEGVLEPLGESAQKPDMSWLDETPVIASSEQSAPAPVKRQPLESADSRQEFKSDRKANADLHQALELMTKQAANPAATARPRFPCAWLVVVEGAGVGEWFVLERGVTHIGSADGQTVRLNFGDDSIAPACHLALLYDERSHGFVLDNNTADPVRLNGAEASPQATLRDGDVVSLGGTSLRLATLCSPNFNWSGAADSKQVTSG